MTQHLWYVRNKRGEISGPFPAHQVQQFFSVGDLDLHDQVSLDGRQWLSLHESGLLEVAHARRSAAEPDDAWRKEREQARLRWLNDSVEVDAASAPTLPGVEIDLKLRRHEEEMRTLLAARGRRRPAFVAGLASLLLIMVVGIGVWLGQSRVSGIQTSLAGKARNCAQAAVEGVNWSGCDKNDARLQGTRLKNAHLAKARFERADLSGADIAYADLSGANLRGADLRSADLRGATLTQADLTGADLSGADLSFAVLTGARLEGARLDGTRLRQSTWSDGRVCGDAAVGICQ